ncbi:MAG: pyridoxamine 5'-phosphate oxidase family protein, partial [Chloroflexota bacterium]
MPADPLPASDIDLNKYAADIDQAMSKGSTVVLATADKQGHVDLGVKGSIFVFDRDHMAYLERTRGTHLKNAQENPHVAFYYSNREAPVPNLRLFGEATVYESGELRDEIRNRTIAVERDRDSENKGAGVLVRIDKIYEPSGV